MSTPFVINAPESTGLSKLHEPSITPPASSTNEASSFENQPSWLSEQYMENHLRAHYKDNNLKILKMSAVPAIGKGENYGGVLTRIKTEYKTTSGNLKVGSFILKTTFEGDEFACSILEPYDLFNCEMSIYEKVFPKLNEMLQNIGDNEQIFPDTIAVDKERQALIFEDLNERGYVMPNRLEGLDMDIAKITLRKLAKMHATSAVLNELENGCLETYDRGMFNRHTENNSPCFLGLIDACSRLLSQWEDYKDYAQKLKDLRPMHMELGKRVFDPIKGYINVLAHGDLWTNNVLVKYDKQSGKPIDVIIIDFQYSAWGSPAIDLFYFLNSSLKEDMHLNRQDELIQYYHSVLANTLEQLSFEAHIPSLHQFQLQLEDKSYYAFNSTCLVLPVQRVEETDDADLYALMEENERAFNFKDTCYKNPYCQKLIKQLLPIYERKGLLDPAQ